MSMDFVHDFLFTYDLEGLYGKELGKYSCENSIILLVSTKGSLTTK